MSGFTSMLHNQGELEAPILDPRNARVGSADNSAVTRDAARLERGNLIRSLLSSHERLERPIERHPAAVARLVHHGVDGGVAGFLNRN